MAQESSVSRSPDSTSRRLMIPGLASGHATFHWIIQSFAVVLPEIQMFFGLNSVGAAGVMSARDLAAGLIALPGGVVVDVLRRYWGVLLAGCLGLAALGSVVMGVSPVYWLLLIGIGVVAISHSVWHLPASASLSYHFADRRGTALSFHGVGGSIGDVAGPLATGALLAFLGWRGLMSIYAIAPFFFGFMAVWTFRHIGRISTESGTPTAPPTVERRLELTRQLLRNPVLWGLTFVRGLRGMCLISLVTILSLYFDDVLEMSEFWRGFHISLLIVVGLVAKTGAGYLSDRFGRKQVLVPGLIWSCLVTLALVPFNEGIAFTIAIALLGLFLYPDQPILTAAVFDVVGREVASTGLGVVACIAFMMSAVSALVAGAIYETMGFAETMYYIAALFGLAAVVFAVLPLSRRPAE